jgi:hypothetical protein
MTVITTGRITITMLYLQKTFFYCEGTTSDQSCVTEVAQFIRVIEIVFFGGMYCN